MRIISEIDDFHPLVSNWLQSQGHTHEHHVKLDDGVVDFVADINGQKTLIECKVKRVRNREIAQLVGYVWDVPNSKGMIALPSNKVDERLITLCERWNIEILPIDISTIPEKSTVQTIDALKDSVSGLLSIIFAWDVLRKDDPEISYRSVVDFYIKKLPLKIDAYLDSQDQDYDIFNAHKPISDALIETRIHEAMGFSKEDMRLLVLSWCNDWLMRLCGESLDIPEIDYSFGSNFSSLLEEIGYEKFFGKTEGMSVRNEIERLLSDGG